MRGWRTRRRCRSGGEGMDSVAIRVFTFSVLPVLIAVGHLGLDRTSRPRERRLEIFLLYLFGVGVAGSGIGGFFGHFISTRSRSPSAGRPVIISSSRLALPTWRWASLALSQ